jgi:spermidine/putrescine transport system substrate-binding protein
MSHLTERVVDPSAPTSSMRTWRVASLVLAVGALLLSACGTTVGETAPDEPDAGASDEQEDAEPAASDDADDSSGADTDEVAGELVLFNYAQYVDPATYEAFSAAFPDVQITDANYASEEEASAQLRAGGAAEYDVVVLAGTTAAQLYADGLLQDIDHSLIPNLANVDPGLIDGSLYDPGAVFSIPKNYGVTGWGYDSEVVTDAPTTWAEFYDQLCDHAPRTLLLEGATAVIGSALQATGSNLGTEDLAEVEAALDLLLEVKPCIGHVSTANFYALMADDIVLGQAWNGDILRLRGDRPALEFQIPEGPSDAWVGVWAIPADAPNPRAAHAWINELLAVDNAAREMEWSLFPVSVPEAAAQVQDTNPAFEVPWITATTEQLQALATPVLSPEALRLYNDAYTRFLAE